MCRAEAISTLSPQTPRDEQERNTIEVELGGVSRLLQDGREIEANSGA